MKHLMIHVDAMDDKPTGAITAIAAAFFNPVTGEVEKTFYRRICLDDAMKNGGTVSAEAIKWCLQIPSAVRDQLLDDDCQDIDLAINDFYDFVIRNNEEFQFIHSWSICPSLHYPALRHSLNKFAEQCFTYAGEQSVTTIIDLASDLGLNLNNIIPREPEMNAYDNVMHNIKLVSYFRMYLDKIASVK